LTSAAAAVAVVVALDPYCTRTVAIGSDVEGEEEEEEEEEEEVLIWCDPDRRCSTVP
jgi:hypothetical protein